MAALASGRFSDHGMSHSGITGITVTVIIRVFSSTVTVTKGILAQTRTRRRPNSLVLTPPAAGPMTESVTVQAESLIM
jgi:hypothetical protein